MTRRTKRIACQIKSRLACGTVSLMEVIDHKVQYCYIKLFTNTQSLHQGHCRPHCLMRETLTFADKFRNRLSCIIVQRYINPFVQNCRPVLLKVCFRSITVRYKFTWQMAQSAGNNPGNSAQVEKSKGALNKLSDIWKHCRL